MEDIPQVERYDRIGPIDLQHTPVPALCLGKVPGGLAFFRPGEEVVGHFDRPS